MWISGSPATPSAAVYEYTGVRCLAINILYNPIKQQSESNFGCA
jgi:hypothetical protein